MLHSDEAVKLPKQSPIESSIMCLIVALSLFSSELPAQNATRAGRFHVENLRPVLWRGYRRRLRMDRVALFVTPPAVASTVTEVLDEPGAVVTMNVAELLLGGTVTLAGTLATEGLLLDSATTVPPAGAGPLRVTVPVAELPAFTVEGESVNDDGTGG